MALAPQEHGQRVPQSGGNWPPRDGLGESQSCPGECWSLPHASEIVISFTQLVGPHKVEGISDLLGKENSPAFSLSYILVPETIYSRF